MLKNITTLAAFVAALGIATANAGASTIAGRVTSFTPTSISVLDKEVITIGLNTDTVFTKLITQKPWQQDTAATANALRVGNFVVVHRPHNALAATWVQVAVGLQGQNSAPDYTVGKKGEIHLNVKVRAGSVVLEPGMYQVGHGLEGTQHFISFNAMPMPAGYRHSNTPVAREASARIACQVVPLDKKAGNTTIILRTNAGGDKEVAEVQVAGESFKHVL